MTKSQLFSLTLACSLIAGLCAPLTAFGCDTVETSTLKSTCVVMEREGHRGVWFSLDRAQVLRAGSLELPQLRLQIETYERLEGKRAGQVTQLTAANTERKAAMAFLQSTIVAHVADTRRAREDAARAREELDRWYRSPWVWFGAGIASGAFAAVLIFD